MEGMNFPRLTTIQRDAIPSPTTDLVIFNTDSSTHETYNGVSWVTFGGGGGGGGGAFNPTVEALFFDDFGFGEPGNDPGVTSVGSMPWFGDYFNGVVLSSDVIHIGHPGVLELHSGTINTSSRGAIFSSESGTTNGDGEFDPAMMFDQTWSVMLPDVTNIQARLGFWMSGAIGDYFFDNGIYFQKTNSLAPWRANCTLGGASTSVLLPESPANGVWDTLRIRRINASDIGFSVNGGAESVISTNVPTVGQTIFASSMIDVGGSNRILLIDYFRMSVSGLTR